MVKFRFGAKSALVIFAVVGLIIFAVVARQSSGSRCDDIDPTSCAVGVLLHNDTPSTYTVRQCGSDDSFPCSTYPDSFKMQPGETHEVAGTSSDAPQPWLVFEGNNLIGCLNLSFETDQNPPANVSLSKLESCNTVKQDISNFKSKYKTF